VVNRFREIMFLGKGEEGRCREILSSLLEQTFKEIRIAVQMR
jgi:hypothetical protein